MRKNSEGYEAIKVSVKPFNVNIASDFWDAYKMTWNTLQDFEFNEQSEACREACIDVALNRALPTPKESLQFNFKIENISRVCLAQITRGRIGWWYVVESQMPEYVSHGVTVPLNLVKSKYYDRIKKLIKDSQDLYSDMSKDMIPPQDLRYLLIHGQQTSMVANVNFSALPGFFALRTENGLTDELNLVARMMKKAIKDYVDDNATGFNKELWYILLSQLDTLGASAKKCVNYDRVFGNTGRYQSANDKVIDANVSNFDFKKSAWYLELLKLPEDLMLPDEKEMIERWKDGKGNQNEIECR